MRDLYASELEERFGEQWKHIDWDASGEVLSRMLTEQLRTRCRVHFEQAQVGAGIIYTRIDVKEFGADPASPKVGEIFESFEWAAFDDR